MGDAGSIMGDAGSIMDDAGSIMGDAGRIMGDVMEYGDMGHHHCQVITLLPQEPHH